MILRHEQRFGIADHEEYQLALNIRELDNQVLHSEAPPKKSCSNLVCNTIHSAP
jgi:hypothetical protein